MKITELRLRKLLGERSTSTPTASWDGPIAAVTRRAGLLKAQLGAFTLLKATAQAFADESDRHNLCTQRILCFRSCHSRLRAVTLALNLLF